MNNKLPFGKIDPALQSLRDSMWMAAYEYLENLTSEEYITDLLTIVKNLSDIDLQKNNDSNFALYAMLGFVELTHKAKERQDDLQSL